MSSVTLTDREVAVLIDSVRYMAETKSSLNARTVLDKINSLMTPATYGLVVSTHRFSCFSNEEIEILEVALTCDVENWKEPSSYIERCRALAQEATDEGKRRPLNDDDD